MQVRRALEKDIPRLEDLLLQVDLVHHNGRPDLFRVGRKYSREELIKILSDENNPVFVAADEQDRVLGYGFCVLKQYINNSILTDIKTLYIDDLCVDEACRKQGVGRTIYEAILAFAKEQGCYNVTLNVWACNENAMKFYRDCGLKPQKIGMETILNEIKE